MITITSFRAGTPRVTQQHRKHLQTIINIVIGIITQSIKLNDSARFICTRDTVDKIYYIYSMDSHEIFHFTYIEDLDTFLEAIQKCSKVKVFNRKDIE